GRQVLELRTPGIDKGNALHAVVEQLEARTIVFAGDDLGDLAAFDAVDELRALGSQGLLICSASDEQDALTARSDVILDGPDGVAGWLSDLAVQLRNRRGVGQRRRRGRIARRPDAVTTGSDTRRGR